MQQSTRYMRCMRVGALLSAVYGHFLLAFYFSSLSILMVEVIAQYNIGRTLGLNIISLSGGLVPLFAFVGGFIITRIGFGKIMFIGQVLVTTGLFATYFVNSVPAILITACAIPATGVGLILSCTFGLAVRFGGRSTNLWIVAIAGGSSLTRAFAPVVFNYFIDAYGWRGACLILSAICFHQLPFICFTILGETRIQSAHTKSQPNVKVKSVCNCLIITVVTNIGFSIFVVYRPFTYMSDFVFSKGFSIADGAFAMSLIGLGSIIGQVAAAIIVKKIKVRSSLWLANLCISSQAVGLAFTFDIGYIVLCVLCVTAGIVWGVLYPFTQICIKDYVDQPRLYAFASGIKCLSDAVLSLTNGPVAGYIRDATGNYKLYIYLIAVIALIPSISLFAVTFRKCDKEPQLDVVTKEIESALVNNKE